jgi:drug/metabolite transporter (DMT)-like permease
MATGDWGALGLLALRWGAGTWLNIVAVEGFGPLTIAFLRVALAALLLGAMLRRRGMPLRIPRRDALPLAVMGLFNTALPFALIAWAALHLDSGLAGILLATTPIFTVLLAHFATGHERLTVAKMTGIGIGMVGVLVTLGRHDLALGGRAGLASLALLGAALAYGIAAVHARSFRDMRPLRLAWGQLAMGTLMLAPCAIVVDQPWHGPDPSWSAITAVLALAVLSTAVRALLAFRLLATVGATNTSLVGFLVPLTSVGLGIAMLGERPGPALAGGLALIGVGMLMVEGRLGRICPTRSWPFARRAGYGCAMEVDRMM